MKKIFMCLLILFLTVVGYGDFSLKYIDNILNFSDKGFSKVFSSFNSSPFGIFKSPQSIDFSQDYRLGLSLSGIFEEGGSLTIASTFKLFDLNFGLGLSGFGIQSEEFAINGNAVGGIQENFILGVVSLTFPESLSFGLVKGSLGFSGFSSLYSISTLTYGVAPVEVFGMLLSGIQLNISDSLDFSLSLGLKMSSIFLDLNPGGFVSASLGIPVLQVLFGNEDLYDALKVFTTFGYTISGLYQDLYYGVGINSKPFDWINLSFSYDSKAISFGIVLELFSSPVGVGIIPSQYQNVTGNIFPNFYTILGEKTVKQILGVSRDVIEVEKGILEFEKGNFTKSKEHFEMALRYNPTNEIATLYLQKLKLRLESEEWLTAEQREFIKTLLVRAKNLEEQRKYGDAMKEYKKVLEINPYNAEAKDGITRIENIVREDVTRNYQEALKLYSKDELEGARDLLVKNLDLNPFHGPSAQLLNEVNDRISASISRKLEQEQKIQLSYAYYRQGMEFYTSYNFSKALEYLNKALEVYPDNKEAKDAISRVLKDVEEYSKVQQNKQLSASIYSQGLKLKNDGKFWEAIDKFKEALKYDKENQNAKVEISNTLAQIRSIGLSLESEGDKLWSETQYDSALEKWIQATNILGELPEALSIAEKIETKKKELASDIDIKITSAKEFFEKGDYKNALKLASVVLSIDKNNKQAIEIISKSRSKIDEIFFSENRKGVEFFNKKDYAKARETFEKLLEVLPENDSRYASVKKYHEESVKKLEEDKTAQFISQKFSEVDIYILNYDFEKAKSVLQEILRVDSKNELAKSKLEEIEIKSKELSLREEASKLVSRGFASIRKQNYAEGIKLLKEAREKYVALKEDTKTIDEYIQKAEEMLKLSQNTFYSEGKKAYENGDLIKARYNLSKALEINPNLSEVKVLLSEVNAKLKIQENQLRSQAEELFTRGEYLRAISLYSNLISIDSNNSYYYQMIEISSEVISNFSIARELIAKENFSEALDVVENIISVNPKDVNGIKIKDEIIEKLALKLEELKKEGLELLAKKDYRKAISRFTTILKFDPNNTEIQIKLEEARVNLEKVVNENLRLGKQSLNNKDYPKAIESLQVVLRYAPDNKEAQNLLSKARQEYNEIIFKKSIDTKKLIDSLLAEGVEKFRKGDIDGAVSTWNKILKIDPNNEQARKYIARAKLSK